MSGVGSPPPLLAPTHVLVVVGGRALWWGVERLSWAGTFVRFECVSRRLGVSTANADIPLHGRGLPCMTASHVNLTVFFCNSVAFAKSKRTLSFVPSRWTRGDITDFETHVAP